MQESEVIEVELSTKIHSCWGCTILAGLAMTAEDEDHKITETSKQEGYEMTVPEPLGSSLRKMQRTETCWLHSRVSISISQQSGAHLLILERRFRD
jgi:hypothetical protein